MVCRQSAGFDIPQYGLGYKGRAAAEASSASRAWIGTPGRNPRLSWSSSTRTDSLSAGAIEHSRIRRRRRESPAPLPTGYLSLHGSSPRSVEIRVLRRSDADLEVGVDGYSPGFCIATYGIRMWNPAPRHISISPSAVSDSERLVRETGLPSRSAIPGPGVRSETP